MTGQSSTAVEDFEVETIAGLVSLVNAISSLPEEEREEAGALVQSFLDREGSSFVVEHIKGLDESCEWKSNWFNLASWIINLRDVNQGYPATVAVELAHSAYQLSESCATINSEKKSLISGNYAYYLSRIGKPEEALHFQKKAVVDTSDAGYSQYVDLNNLALTYGALGRDSLWLAVRQETLQYAIVQKLDSSVIRSAFANLIGVQVQLGLFEAATKSQRWENKHFNESKEIRQYGHFDMGQLKNYCDNRDYKKAISYSETLNAESGSFREVAINGWLLEAYLGVGNYMAALECLESNLNYWNREYHKHPGELGRWTKSHQSLLGTYEDIFYVCSRWDDLTIWESHQSSYIDLKMPLWKAHVNSLDSSTLSVTAFTVTGSHCIFNDVELDSVIQVAKQLGKTELLDEFVKENKRVLILSTRNGSLKSTSRAISELEEIVLNQNMILNNTAEGGELRLNYLNSFLDFGQVELKASGLLEYNVDGVLSDLSFELLWPGAHRYSLFAGSDKDKKRNSGGALICSAPKNTLPHLPGALTEGRELLKMFKNAGARARLLSGREFSQKNVTRVINNNDPRILHFACHGDFLDLKDFGMDLQEFVSVLNENFGMVKQFSIEEGLENLFILYMAERNGDGMTPASIFNWAMNLSSLEVVFLNSCNSLKPIAIDHFGHRMFADVFHRGNVEYCISNRFPVKDDVALSFAEKFYSNLLENAEVEDAFQQTLEKCLSEGATPAQLASFALSKRCAVTRKMPERKIH